MDPFGRWPNLAAMMLGLAAERGERPMLRSWHTQAWRETSWNAFALQAASLAKALAPRLAEGAPVLLVSEARPEVPVSNVALQILGAVPMPAYATNLAADHAHLLRDSGARAAICATAALAERVLAGAAQVSGLDFLICMEPFSTAACPVLAWDRLVADADALPWAVARAARIGRQAIAVLMYTSGTGGAPKGVALPHRAIMANGAGVVPVVASLKLDGTLYLSILPLSHSYEYTVGQYILPAIGCQVVFARGIEALASDMRTIRPHIMTVVPRVLEVIRGRVLAEVGRASPWRQALFTRALALGKRRIAGRLSLPGQLAHRVLDRLVAAKVRVRFGGRLIALVSGGARLDPEIGEFFAAMGLLVLQGYGQTEAGPVISVNPPSAVRVRTVGPPLAGVDLRIASDGEILVRGDLVMAGYHNRPDETAASIVDGWLHTGDIGAIEDGYLVITDRKKDIIVLSGGENISPARIEGLLMSDSEISQAVVMGDGAAGLTALLVAAEGADAGLGFQRVNARLGGAEKMRRYQTVPAFTLENGLLTATQKIRRRAVIEKYKK